MKEQVDIIREIDNKQWNYLLQIANITSCQLRYEENIGKLHINYISGNNNVTISPCDVKYYMKLLCCLSRLKKQKDKDEFVFMTNNNVYLLSDIKFNNE